MNYIDILFLFNNLSHLKRSTMPYQYVQNNIEFAIGDGLTTVYWYSIMLMLIEDYIE